MEQPVVCKLLPCYLSVTLPLEIAGWRCSYMEHALLYTFLEASSDCKFKDQLWSLKSPGPAVFQGLSDRRISQPVSAFDDEFELQCDGNRSGHFQNGELESDATVDEDVIRIIAAQLAKIGDKLDKDVQARAVDDLVQYFLNESLSRQEIMRHMSRVVTELAQAIPSDMEQEKFMLVLTMVLTKKIVNTVPSLLHRVFSTSVNFISEQFHNYVVEMLGE
ncbi:BH3-interacting domain death agonist [Empidonax traillii]|uniref:BH3-interacting domain death agonist n=1 Tax=Empidonax traillii TaxID=164674 RepID=UPI000FFD245A|nr:BH3-interacting domain death agonist [Empidonax traillii]